MTSILIFINMHYYSDQVSGIGTGAKGLVTAKYNTGKYKPKTRIKNSPPKKTPKYTTLLTKKGIKRGQNKDVLLYKQYWQTIYVKFLDITKSKTVAKYLLTQL